MMRLSDMSVFQRICLLLGIALIVTAAGAFGWWTYEVHASEQRAASYVDTIRALTPEPQGAVLEKQKDKSMAALSIDSTDFIGLLEFPAFHSILPVCDRWERLSKYPCRYNGSIYDGSLQVGGTSQKGQYDFYRNISVGDEVFFTDMRGNRYSYTVGNIHHADCADQTTLEAEQSDLTLFIKNIYGFDYTLVFCESRRNDIP